MRGGVAFHSGKLAMSGVVLELCSPSLFPRKQFFIVVSLACGSVAALERDGRALKDWP